MQLVPWVVLWKGLAKSLELPSKGLILFWLPKESGLHLKLRSWSIATIIVHSRKFWRRLLSKTRLIIYTNFLKELNPREAGVKKPYRSFFNHLTKKINLTWPCSSEMLLLTILTKSFIRELEWEKTIGIQMDIQPLIWRSSSRSLSWRSAQFTPSIWMLALPSAISARILVDRRLPSTSILAML